MAIDGSVTREAFASAAGRHLDDADLLLHCGRFDNAAYLAGYVVECSLKFVVEAAGLSGAPYRHDIVMLSREALNLACLLTPTVWRYQAPQTPEMTDLHSTWNPSLRYSRTGEVPQSTAQRFLRAAYDTYAATTVQAILDGRKEA